MTNKKRKISFDGEESLPPSLYKQFLVDLPRLKLFLDGEVFDKSAESLIKHLKDTIKNPAHINFCIYFLTQSSLAKFYTREFKKIKNECEHLVDDGNYVVYLDTKSKTITVSKDFRKIYLEGEHSFQLDFANLSICYDLNQKILSHEWDYEFKESIFNPTVLTIKN